MRRSASLALGVAFVGGVSLLGVCTCGPGLARPRPDSALGAVDPEALDFTAAKTGLLPPDHDPAIGGRPYRIVVHEERVSSTFDATRQVLRAKLGAYAVSTPDDVRWFDDGFELPPEDAYLAFDASPFGDGAIVVAASIHGLVEYHLAARADGSVEASRRTLTGPAARAPLLVLAEEDLLLFHAEFSTASRRTLQGGLHLIVSRRGHGRAEWKDPYTLTLDLAGAPVNQRAVAVRGDRVSVAWGENRFAEDGPGWGADFRCTGKLCVATSADRGATWSAPVLLHDPEDEHTSTGQGLALFDDGRRLVVVCKDAPEWKSEAGTVGETMLLAYDLRTWFPDLRTGWSTLARLAEGKR